MALRGTLNLAFIMPRDASLSDSGCIFFQSMVRTDLFRMYTSSEEDFGFFLPFDFEPDGVPYGSTNGIPFGLYSEENCHYDHISFNLKGN